MEMWLQIKTPEIADGNNFGVEVQAFVAGELKVPDGPWIAVAMSAFIYGRAKRT